MYIIRAAEGGPNFFFNTLPYTGPKWPKKNWAAEGARKFFSTPFHTQDQNGPKIFFHNFKSRDNFKSILDPPPAGAAGGGLAPPGFGKWIFFGNFWALFFLV